MQATDVDLAVRALPSAKTPHLIGIKMEFVILLGGMLVLLLLGIRVAYALVAVGLLGMYLLVDPPQHLELGTQMWKGANVYALTAVPLFILMAELLFRSGISSSAYSSIANILRFVPGGSAYTNVLGSTVFAAMSGSSVANAATIGTLAGPDMVKQGYSKKLTFGSIASGGTLGILMPPSTPLIIYGSLTGVSVGQLFMGGIVPALLLASSFMVVIFVWSLTDSSAAPRQAPVGWRVQVKGLLSLIPIVALIGFVLGGIYAGIFTPTEAGGMGAFGALLLGMAYRRVNLKTLWAAAHSTALTSSMILLIIAAAALLTYVMAILGLPTALAIWVTDLGLPLVAILVAIAVMYVVLGLFIETVSLIALTVPIVFPMLDLLGVDGVWLGIYTVLLIEIGLLTPPVGLNLYVLQQVPAGQSFGDIALGSLPFIGMLVVLAILISVFPNIVTWLPGLLST